LQILKLQGRLRYSKCHYSFKTSKELIELPYYTIQPFTGHYNAFTIERNTNNI